MAKIPAKTRKRLEAAGWEFREQVLRIEVPHLFDSIVQPLALGAYRQIRDAYGERISARELSAFLTSWVKTKRYAETLAKGTHRYNLDGSQSEPVSEEHRNHALRTLRNMEESRKKAQKRKAKQSAQTRTTANVVNENGKLKLRIKDPKKATVHVKRSRIMEKTG